MKVITVKKIMFILLLSLSMIGWATMAVQAITLTVTSGQQQPPQSATFTSVKTTIVYYTWSGNSSKPSKRNLQGESL